MRHNLSDASFDVLSVGLSLDELHAYTVLSYDVDARSQIAFRHLDTVQGVDAVGNLGCMSGFDVADAINGAFYDIGEILPVERALVVVDRASRNMHCTCGIYILFESTLVGCRSLFSLV